MKLRKALLATMLWSLGLAAVAGVAAALVGPGQIGWHFIGTALMTAVASGLLLSAGRLVDRARTRAAGLLGMTVVVAEYLLGLVLVWETGPFVGSGEGIALTMLAIVCTAPSAMILLTLARSPKSGVAGWLGLVPTVAAFVLALAGAWISDSTREQLWSSAGVLGGFGMVAALCVAGVQIRAWSWRWIGPSSTAAAAIMALIAIWTSRSGTSLTFTILISAGVVVAHANLALMCPLRPGQGWVRVVTIISVVIAAALIALTVSSSGRFAPDDMTDRALMAAGIVAGCGSLALVVLARLNRRGEQVPAEKVLSVVSLTCPHCSAKQVLPTGDSACSACGLRFHIRVEEPRCVGCGYLLYGLKSDRCPECGLQFSMAPPAQFMPV